MTTKTDLHSLRELRSIYMPATRGFVTNNETYVIHRTLELETRNNVELQNIRDMCVMMYYQMAESKQNQNDAKKAMQTMDAMNAICTVIDQEKAKRGLEV